MRFISRISDSDSDSDYYYYLLLLLLLFILNIITILLLVLLSAITIISTKGRGRADYHLCIYLLLLAWMLNKNNKPSGMMVAGSVGPLLLYGIYISFNVDLAGYSKEIAFITNTAKVASHRLASWRPRLINGSTSASTTLNI